ncbi:sulfatase family protein [Sedimentimonas flavescens]|uniref:sulfatase family protein n=1 Tax=Sedimentimonas flavescens TaxID=2851012 RepID=UPI0021A8466B|nr:sulfatase-like hydrolase/transferase [Sedimentimonas flavescens]MCT2538908.1 sulfatase-like hydrolase/transferase [Sedimentimonas flavescens]
MANSTLPEALGLMARGLWQDLGLTLLLTFATLSALRSLPRGRNAARATRLFTFLASTVMLWSLINIVAVRMLGSPVTADWLAFSDIERAGTVPNALRRLLGLREALLALAALTVLLGGARILSRHPGKRAIAGALMAAYALITIWGLALSDGPAPVSRGRLVNPVIAFLGSFGDDGGLVGLSELGAGTLRTQMPFGPATPLARPPIPEKPLRNVILFALESVPARQAQGWEGTHPVTPNLAASLDHALAFDRAYAHVPASNYFLVSAFGALIPELSTDLMTASRPGLDLTTLPEVLGAAGLRTAYFESADTRFQDAETFLNAEGFGVVRDYRDWDCAGGIYEVESVTDRFLTTSNDLCTVREVERWIAQEPDQPFFLAMRTGMTHYPYFPGAEPQVYVEDQTHNDYLNALRVGDQALGTLMDYLDRSELSAQTLVIVLGDHGEAFGEHGTYVHAAAVHEENIRIPLALINPQLFSGQRSDLLVGMIDVAPTITDLLGIVAPASWQGRSVFAPDRQDGVFFYAPWNGFQVGYREGDRKYIYNGNTGEEQLYDLRADPDEQHNLAPDNPALAAAARDKLGDAIAAQNAFTDRLLSAGAVAPRAPARADEIVLEVSGTRYQSAPRAWITLDGAHVAVIEVTDAPSNAEREARQDEIDRALMTFRLPVSAPPCPRQIGIYFLNDEWAGDGKSGDTDLLVRSVQFAGRSYYFNSFTLLTEGAGKNAGEYFRMSRSGEFRVELALDKACLSAGLAQP